MPIKPSEKEEEYFARLEMEQRKKREVEGQKRFAEEEKKRLKELHYMHCPKCGMELSEIDYKGIRIDKCFHCEGIWLDAGELDELSSLEKSALTRLFFTFRK